jgi:arylsulfatase A-like enzyme
MGSGAVTYARERLTRQSGAITTQKPFFRVVLSDGERWHVEVEWPDGTIEQIDAFKADLEGVNWVRSQSEAWLRECENTNFLTISGNNRCPAYFFAI